MKNELKIGLLNQVTGGASKAGGSLVIEPVPTVDGEEDTVRWRKKYRERSRDNDLASDDVAVITITTTVTP